jgi:pyruvate/2-oxoglutarate dehydrogenase complex dihydrolipoamide dehydrogenase (E3) component
MNKTFDAIILGAGQAGPPLAERLTTKGMTVALVERKLFGGTCVNTGCMPTKTLVASAYAAHLVRRAADFGVRLEGDVGVDMKRVKARADAVSSHARQGVESWLAGMKTCTLFRGHARFESPSEVRVGDDVLRGERIFVNVGGRAVVPNLPGVDRIPYLTNRSILELDTLPEHLVVIGGSYVGLEFAQMYRRFGSRVTVVEKGSRLIAREDPDVSLAVKEILEREGITVRLDAECIRFDPRANSASAAGAKDSIAVGVDCHDEPPEILGSHVLLAVGRRPNTDDLDVEKAGALLDDRGYVTVDDSLRTRVPTIWAMGDCNGKGAFTHTAYNDFEIVAANLLDGESRKVSERILGYALYIDPPLGRVGLGETDARKMGRKIRVGKRAMTRVGRAIEKAETQGFMKVVVDAESQLILGATILGVCGDEAIHGVLDMMNAKAPYTTLQRAMPIHPTVSELIPTVLGALVDAF